MASTRRLALLSDLLAVPAGRYRGVNFGNFEPAVREVEVLERYDRRVDGWTEDHGVGPRFLPKMYRLLVSENESLFDKLVRRVAWENWQSLLGQVDRHPAIGFECRGFSDEAIDTTRATVNYWQRRWFRTGHEHTGYLMLTHNDPNFFTTTARPRPPYRLPYHTDRRA